MINELFELHSLMMFVTLNAILSKKGGPLDVTTRSRRSQRLSLPDFIPGS